MLIRIQEEIDGLSITKKIFEELDKNLVIYSLFSDILQLHKENNVFRIYKENCDLRKKEKNEIRKEQRK